MPSTSLQSRISAFESLTGSSPSKPVKASKLPTRNLLETPSLSVVPFSPPKVPSRSPSPSPPNLGRKTSLIDLKDWIVDDGPPKHNGFVSHRTNGKPGGIDNLTQTPTRRMLGLDGTKTPTNGHSFVSTPLINLESPPKPPLPPRKAYHNSPPGPPKAISMRNASSTSLPPPKRADSLTVEHTYPPLSKLDISDASRRSPSHAPASSISSFHSVSLSSDGGNTDPSTPGSVTNFISTFPMDQDGSEADTVSLDESYENVSVTSIASPTTAATLALNWEKAMAQRGAPKLPQRSASKPSPTPVSPPTAVGPRRMFSPTSSSSQSTAVRRVPPPPPSRPASSRTSLISNTTSDRSSILSTAASATTSHTSILSQPTHQLPVSRPTPVPAAARKRYESVFVANVLKNRKQPVFKPNLLSAKKSRQAAGWRGLSVDLITNPGEHLLDSVTGKGTSKDRIAKKDGEEVGADERLHGSIVKLVWSTSKLDKGKLRDIWNECDTTSLGSLDCDLFVRGMWRIDEELRRAHTKTSSGYVYTAPLASRSSRSRQVPRYSNTKLILR